MRHKTNFEAGEIWNESAYLARPDAPVSLPTFIPPRCKGWCERAAGRVAELEKTVAALRQSRSELQSGREMAEKRMRIAESRVKEFEAAGTNHGQVILSIVSEISEMTLRNQILHLAPSNLFRMLSEAELARREATK